MKLSPSPALSYILGCYLSDGCLSNYKGQCQYIQVTADKEVADVVSFVRSSWGNQGAAVTASDVAKVRKEIGAAPQPVRAQ